MRVRQPDQRLDALSNIGPQLTVVLDVAATVVLDGEGGVVVIAVDELGEAVLADDNCVALITTAGSEAPVSAEPPAVTNVTDVTVTCEEAREDVDGKLVSVLVTTDPGAKTVRTPLLLALLVDLVASMLATSDAMAAAAEEASVVEVEDVEGVEELLALVVVVTEKVVVTVVGSGVIVTVIAIG